MSHLRVLSAKRGPSIFAHIDHARAATDAGLTMPSTQLLVVGNPASGTPLMLAAPSVAIDLPLKILVWEDTSGRVWLSYNESHYLQQRHQFPSSCREH